MYVMSPTVKISLKSSHDFTKVTISHGYYYLTTGCDDLFWSAKIVNRRAQGKSYTVSFP